MPVIDDPISMMRCTNKVYIWERLIGAGLPSPQTVLVQDKTNLEEVADTLSFPVVLKIPDGSFSRGIKKANDMAELKQLVHDFLEDTDSSSPRNSCPPSSTGVSACSTAGRSSSASTRWRAATGRSSTTRATDAPSRAASTPFRSPMRRPTSSTSALRAANLIGDGFYGVDLKTGPDGPVVIEINDNPNLEHGIEDASEKTAVWSHLTEWFVKRLNGWHRGRRSCDGRNHTGLQRLSRREVAHPRIRRLAGDALADRRQRKRRRRSDVRQFFQLTGVATGALLRARGE